MAIKQPGFGNQPCGENGADSQGGTDFTHSIIRWFEFLAFETFSAPIEKDILVVRLMAGEDRVLGEELCSRFSRSRVAPRGLVGRRKAA